MPARYWYIVLHGRAQRPAPTKTFLKRYNAMKQIIPMLLSVLLLAGCTAPAEPQPKVPDEPAPVEAPVEAPPEEPARIEYEPGIIEGETYINDFFGVRYTLGEGWTWNTDSANENELNVSYEMFAFGDEGLQNLSFTAGEGTSDEAVSDYLADLPAAIEDTGYTDYGYNEVTVTIGGRDCPGVMLSGTLEIVEGVSAPVYILTVFLDREGYYGEFTATSFVKDCTAEIFEGVTR